MAINFLFSLALKCPSIFYGHHHIIAMDDDDDAQSSSSQLSLVDSATFDSETDNDDIAESSNPSFSKKAA